MTTVGNPESRSLLLSVRQYALAAWKRAASQNQLLTTIFGGRQGRCCTRMLAISGQPCAEWALRLICSTLITFFGSEALTDHELLRFSSSANVLVVLVLRDLSFTTPKKSLVQRSQNF